MISRVPARWLSLASTKLRLYSVLILPAVVFLAAVAFYTFNARLFAPLTFSGDNQVVGDPHQIADAMRTLTLDRDMRKHVLFSITTAPLVDALQIALPVREREAIARVLGLIAGLNILGVFLLLRHFLSSTRSALPFTVLFASFFLNLVLFSIPESYALSNVWIIVYVSYLLRVHKRLDPRNSLTLSFVAGLASLYNPPLLSLMVIHIILLFRQMDVRAWLKTALADIALGASVFLITNFLLQGWSFARFALAYGGQQFSRSGGPHLDSPASVLANFFLYSILSPVDHLPGYLGLHDLSGYLRSATGLLLLPVVVGGVASAVVISIRASTMHRHLASSLLAWILLMVVFYTLYRPDTATLWVMQILLPLLILVVIAFKSIPVPEHIKLACALLVSGVLAVHNCAALYAGVLP